MTPQPGRFFQLSLIFLVALNLVPHFNDYTVPTLAVGGICLCWRLLYEFQLVPLPNFFTKVGLVLSLTYLVYINFGQLLGLEAGSALLICAVSLKLIDRVAYRDAMILLFLNFMLLLARFFESQSLGITIFAAFDLIITTALLVQLHQGRQMSFDFGALLKTSFKLIVQVAPLMILLFFVFPRFSTNFVNSRDRAKRLNSFSDTMEPGSLSRLAQQERIAFRARFFGEVPSPLDRYWRGMVLTINQGMKWERGNLPKPDIKSNAMELKGSLRQEILMEPNFNDWLFSMEFPIAIVHRKKSLQKRTVQLAGAMYALDRPYSKKFVYDVYSRPEQSDALGPELRAPFLQTPEEKDPRVLELVRSISSGARSNEHKALRLMQFYQKQFRYSLEPGKLKSNELGEFLFEKRVGFCEHFAVSFAALMRLAEVPARVIVGFQGGRQNQVSDYYRVTSQDAHAWTEIWSDEKRRWMRFDPTTMVAPLRFELGGEIYHSLSEEDLLLASGEGFLNSFDAGLWAQGRLMADALATNWNLFLLNYDQVGQQEFFARLGVGHINQNLLLSLSLVILLLFFLWVRRVGQEKGRAEPPSQKAYMNLRKRLARKRLEKEAHERPRDFLIRCTQELPQWEQDLEEFQDLYLKAYYGDQETGRELTQIAKKIS